jgi:hypothetical protein
MAASSLPQQKWTSKLSNELFDLNRFEVWTETHYLLDIVMKSECNLEKYEKIVKTERLDEHF